MLRLLKFLNQQNLENFSSGTALSRAVFTINSFDAYLSEAYYMSKGEFERLGSATRANQIPACRNSN